MLGNQTDAMQLLAACCTELIRLEDWVWAASSLESRSLVSKDTNYLRQAINIY